MSHQPTTSICCLVVGIVFENRVERRTINTPKLDERVLESTGHYGGVVVELHAGHVVVGVVESVHAGTWQRRLDSVELYFSSRILNLGQCLFQVKGCLLGQWKKVSAWGVFAGRISLEVFFVFLHQGLVVVLIFLGLVFLLDLCFQFLGKLRVVREFSKLDSLAVKSVRRIGVLSGSVRLLVQQLEDGGNSLRRFAAVLFLGCDFHLGCYGHCIVDESDNDSSANGFIFIKETQNQVHGHFGNSNVILLGAK
ncbi:hypothetical protein OGAPHI_004359 [Ogataea philodendri]|uniref:Uncharacterized protein n=1 Tax=Ogataea philodendri TaxID=1378263 RepID=A0A9P8T5J8_9ASCO|nr:uncharacterized protein OGAPHI_004359 [Ogataea philodendri]KAH3666170.1 hypothetical protein OGAPHI_004359 [Ogataea philodendri]